MRRDGRNTHGTPPPQVLNFRVEGRKALQISALIDAGCVD